MQLHLIASRQIELKIWNAGPKFDLPINTNRLHVSTAYRNAFARTLFNCHLVFNDPLLAFWVERNTLLTKCCRKRKRLQNVSYWKALTAYFPFFGFCFHSMHIKAGRKPTTGAGARRWNRTVGPWFMGKYSRSIQITCSALIFSGFSPAAHPPSGERYVSSRIDKNTESYWNLF